MNGKGIQAVIKYTELANGISQRSIFGGIGYFSYDAMFLLIHEGKPYLRGGDNLSDRFKSLGCKQLAFQKRLGKAKLDYFNIQSLYNDNFELFEELFVISTKTAISDRGMVSNVKRLRDLPNLQLKIERMLVKVGIENVDILFAMGSAEAFMKLQLVYGFDLTLDLLWKLEGAITQVHYSLLGHEVKNRLLLKISPNHSGYY
jgi:DNA transformation protein